MRIAIGFDNLIITLTVYDYKFHKLTYLYIIRLIHRYTNFATSSGAAKLETTVQLSLYTEPYRCQTTQNRSQIYEYQILNVVIHLVSLIPISLVTHLGKQYTSKTILRSMSTSKI